MDQAKVNTKGYTFLRSKRDTCLACELRTQCIRPPKDTEDEDTSLYDCPVYRIAK
jgi:hypothetical protein